MENAIDATTQPANTLDQSVTKAMEGEKSEQQQLLDKLLPLATSRLATAKAFTKEFIEEVKRSLDDYEAKEKMKNPLVQQDIQRRYEFPIPYIYATHESMLAEITDKIPELIFTNRGRLEDETVQKVQAAYDYIWDTCDLDHFMMQAAWWYLLTGWVTSTQYYKKEYEEMPAVDPESGEVMTDDETGEEITQPITTYDDPVAEIDDPTKMFFSPESQYTMQGDKVPFHFKSASLPKAEIDAKYESDVECDEEIKVDGLDTKESKTIDKDDIKRATVYYMYSDIPAEWVKKAPELFPDWDVKAMYLFVFTTKQGLHIERLRRNNCKMLRWHGKPNSFFGFGLAKTLRSFQRELSIRRGQQVRYADVAAFAKIALPSDSETDAKSLRDPRENTVVLFREKMPAYLTPPDLSQTLIITEQKAREDAHFVSGMMDMSKGAQDSNTVNTATGQTIFAESAAKRIKKARTELGRFLRLVVIDLLKLCQENWDEPKKLTVTDEDGNEEEVEVTGQDFDEVNFDTDVDIDIDSITVNKEVMREQSIALYDKSKDDPLIDRRKLFTKMLRDGFNVQNAESYLKKSELQPGQILVDQQSGQQYTVDESGEVVPAEATEDLAQPSGDEMASTQEGALNVQP